MLKEIRECDESQYLVNTSNPLKRSNTMISHLANVWEDPEDYQSDSLSEVESERENDDVQQDKSYHVGVMMMADEGKAFFGKCYYCGEPGHPWHDCKKPLKPALRLALNSEIERKAKRMEKKQLNPNGGARVKRGRIPKVPPAPVQNWEPLMILPVPTGMRTLEIGGWDQKTLLKPWLMVNQSQPSSIMVPESTRSCHPLSRDMAWWLAPSLISTSIRVKFQLVVVGVIIQNLSDMSWSGYNSPESPHMMRIRWLWLLEIGVSSVGECRW